MRIYKFRGFHADENGKTVIKLNGKEIKGTWYKGDLSTDGGYYIQAHAVLPETVGQYICDDRNGKEVYEGDVVVLYLSNSCIACALTWENGGFILRNSMSVFYLNRLMEQNLADIDVRNNIFEAPILAEELEVEE